MIQSSKVHHFKVDKILVPMAKGSTSAVVLNLGFSLSKIFGSEITALTVKEEIKEITWSDKISVVVSAYKDGLENDVKVVPKVRTSKTVKFGIVEEAKSRGYDLILIATFKRSMFSASVFGNIGDYVLKHSDVPVGLINTNKEAPKYKTILVPLSEQLVEKDSILFALNVKKALGCKLIMADLRDYDEKPSQKFTSLIDNIGEIISNFGEGISIVRSHRKPNLSEELLQITKENSIDAIAIGIKEIGSHRIRYSSLLKGLIKGTDQDIIAYRK